MKERKPGEGDMILCCLYWDGKLKNSLPEKFLAAVEHADEKNIPILVCGDFNEDSDSWGSPYSNLRGVSMEETIILNDFCVLNEESKQTY